MWFPEGVYIIAPWGEGLGGTVHTVPCSGISLRGLPRGSVRPSDPVRCAPPALFIVARGHRSLVRPRGKSGARGRGASVEPPKPRGGQSGPGTQLTGALVSQNGIRRRQMFLGGSKLVDNHFFPTEHPGT